MYKDRLIELSRRLADHQREIDALRSQAATPSAGPVVMPPSMPPPTRAQAVKGLVRGLVRLEPEAFHAAAGIARRRTRRVLARLRGEAYGPGGPQPMLPGAPPPAVAAVPAEHVASRYAAWRALIEPDQAQLDAQRRTSAAWVEAPLVSVVVPVFHPPADAFADTIASVRAQSVERWQLVLVLAGPQPAAVDAVAQRVADDPRVTVVGLPENLGIAANTRAGIEACAGAYVAFLDHDDLWAPDTLFEVLRVLRVDPTVDVVTFDEDKMAADGQTRIDPLFKPVWASPEHLLSINDRMHSVVRKASIERAGGLAAGVDGAQDWDLGLRLLEIGARVRHVPRVLYHWRVVPGSAAGDALAKPWAFDAQLVALRGHLSRLGRADVTAAHTQIGVVRVGWRASGRKATIIIPTKDKADLLGVCLRSIFERTSYPDFEILIVDTGSREAATRALYATYASEPRLRVIHDDAPFNFSRVNNVAARQATGDILVFLNNDTEVIAADWLEELVRWADLPEVGCVGPKLLYPNGTIQHAGIITGLGGHGSHIYQGGPGTHTWGIFGSVEFYRNYLMLGGAALAIRRDLFETLRGFDEEYVLCYSDLDLCLKAAEAGYRNVYTPFSVLYHHEGGTRGLSFPPGDVARATIRMFALIIQGEPFFNPNLSFHERMPTLAVLEGPEGRAALLMHIASLFGVLGDVQKALHDELLGRTQDWRGYEHLLRASHPPVPVRTPAPGRRRYLFVSHDLSRSGAPMVLVHLARELVREGHTVTVLASRKGRLREEFEEAGADVQITPLVLEAPYALRPLFEAYDVIIPNTILGWRVVLAASASDIPVIWLLHESDYAHVYLRQFPEALQALAVADDVVLPSESARSRYRHVDAGNLSVEIYGFDRPVVTSPLPELDRRLFHFAILASVESRKGQDLLVSAVRLLPAPVRDRMVVHSVGRVLDPVFAEHVRSLAASYPVIFHGEVSPAEALAWLSAAAGFVCTSRDEAGPCVLIEAMALAKPVISTPVGYVPDLIDHGVSGLIVPHQDPAALAAAMTRFVEDREATRKMGDAAGRRYDERLTLAPYARAIAERAERAIGARAARGRS